MAAADVNMSLMEGDGAYANLKLDAHRQNVLEGVRPTEMTDFGVCHLHGNKLAEAAVVTAVGIKCFGTHV